MEFLNYIFAIVVVLGLVFFFHEFGHFITARAFGMRVPVFSFGMGKRLIGFKWGDTDCRLSLIPIGAYVMLEGEPEDGLTGSLEADSAPAPAVDPSRNFALRPRWQRFIVYLAGPIMNGVLTVAVLTGLYMYGFDVDATPFDRPLIGAVDAGSPAAVAGIQPGDAIVAVDGHPLATWEEAQYAIVLHPDQDMTVRVRRNGSEQDFALRTGVMPKERVGTIGAYPVVRVGELVAGGAAGAAGLRPDDGILTVADIPITSFADIPAAIRGKAGQSLTFRVLRDGLLLSIPITPKDDAGTARIGIGPKLVKKRFGPARAFVEACRWAADNVRLTIRVLRGLLTAQLSPKSMMGPLGIAQASGEAARHGFGSVFMLVAMISLQVGIFNLFPLMPLDGGHLAILAGESVLRRDMSVLVKERIATAGVGVILLLIAVALYSDLSRTALGRFLP